MFKFHNYLTYLIKLNKSSPFWDLCFLAASIIKKYQLLILHLMYSNFLCTAMLSYVFFSQVCTYSFVLFLLWYVFLLFGLSSFVRNRFFFCILFRYVYFSLRIFLLFLFFSSYASFSFVFFSFVFLPWKLLIASITAASVSLSNAEVASSNTRISGL